MLLNSNMSKNLYIFTTSFPFGVGEQYIENELPFLVDKFDIVYVVPSSMDGEARELLQGVKLLDLHSKINWGLFNKFNYAIKALFLGGKGNEYLSNRISFSNNFKTAYNAIAYKIALKRIIDQEKDQSAVFYSYWFYHWAFVLAILKKENKELKCVSRAHMGDIYDEIKQTPFKGFKLRNLSEIYPISNHAKQYLQKYDSSFSSSLNVQYLGVKSLGLNPPRNIEKSFTIVTCSTIRKAKRIDFIARVVKECKSTINWVHFGDGPEKELVKGIITQFPTQIKAELKGFVKNQEVLEYYLSNNIDLFINLSSQEGLPVSLMEAIGFGIPVMATNVYGTPEIVSEETGVLIELEESEVSIARKIDRFLSEFSAESEKIKQIWDNKFNADKNYRTFTERLYKL